MTFTRRGFLGLLATSAVGACVAVKVPTGWLPEPVRRLAASEFLRKQFNGFSEGTFNFPTELRAGRALFEAYESEVVCLCRYTPSPMMASVPCEPSLMFKCAVMRQDKTLPPWDVILVGSNGALRYARFTPSSLRSAA